MESEIEKDISLLRDHLKDPSQKTYKMLINNLSSLTLHLDKGEVEVWLCKVECR